MPCRAMDDRQAAGETHFQRAEACLPHLLGRVTLAPAAPRRIDGGLPTEGAIAHRLVSRFANHLAFYRQSQFLARCGMQIDRSTRADWSGSAAFLLSLQLPSCLMAFGGSRCKREPPPSPAFMPGGGGIRHRPVGARATAPRAGHRPLGAFGPLLLPPDAKTGTMRSGRPRHRVV